MIPQEQALKVSMLTDAHVTHFVFHTPRQLEVGSSDPALAGLWNMKGKYQPPFKTVCLLSTPQCQ